MIYIALTIVALIWGVNIVVVKMLVSTLPVLTTTALRIMLGGAFIGCYTLIRKDYIKLNGNNWLFIILGSLGLSGHHFFLVLGLSKTFAINGSLILSLNPLVTALLAYFILKSNLTGWRILGIFIGLLGVGITLLYGLSFNSIETSVGDIMIIIAVFCQSVSFLSIKKITGIIPVNQITALIVIICGLILIPVALMIEKIEITSIIIKLTPFLWFLLIYSAVIATGVGNVIWNIGIKKIGPSQTSIFFNLIPLFTGISSIIFLGEMLSVYQVTGFFFIVCGILLGSGYYEKYIMHKFKSD